MSENTFTKEAIIRDWSDDFQERVAAPRNDAELYAARVGFYVTAPTLRQYQAFAAFASVMAVLRLRELPEPQQMEVMSATVGTQYPDVKPEALSAVIDEHAIAWSRVYDAEVKAALGEMSI